MRATKILLFSISNTLHAAIKGGSIQWLAAGFATRVGGEIKIIGRIMPPATETRVRELAWWNGLRGLAPRASPIAGGGKRGICRGSRGARPLADAVEVEDGEACGA